VILSDLIYFIASNPATRSALRTSSKIGRSMNTMKFQGSLPLSWAAFFFSSALDRYRRQSRYFCGTRRCGLHALRAVYDITSSGL